MTPNQAEKELLNLIKHQKDQFDLTIFQKIIIWVLLVGGLTLLNYIKQQTL